MSYLNSVEIMDKGMKCLLDAMGAVETEKFISAVLREKFNYTEWRKNYFDDMSPKEFNEQAAYYAKINPFVPLKKQVKI
ncbi:MAG: hypothetical protein IJU91_00455 [Selenomonadaceae bacterium]|nr:hypothetical protein [Selenomonadaceae bacterium]